MSVALDQAFYAKLTGDTGTGGVNHASTGATGGFHQFIAPQGAGFPRVHFQELVTTGNYSFRNLTSDHVYYQFIAYAVDGNEEGATQAGNLAERIRVLLTDPSMAVTGKTLIYCRFERSIVPRPEWDEAGGGRYIYAKGLIVEAWLA